MDPQTPAVALAAERYYAERSAASLRNRIEHSARLVRSLRLATGGDIELRYTSHAMAVGVIAVNASTPARDGSTVLLCEYFT